VAETDGVVWVSLVENFIDFRQIMRSQTLDPLESWLYRALRYGAAFVIMGYGFAKLNGSQFEIIDSQLDRPMGQVSGFWLTWYYFGYSPVYGNLLGVAQIAAGILLIFRKTALLGSVLLLPIISNIVLVNLFYGIDPGALIVALLLFFGVLLIVAFHIEELLELFWRRQNRILPDKPASRRRTFAINTVRVLLIATPAIFTYWVANHVKRRPTPIDGTWEVVSVSPANDADAAPLATAFFERNRAFMCVFKRRDGQYEEHHFEVDAKNQTLTIWQEWLKKGNVVFTGSYELSGDELKIRGRFANEAPQEVILTLRKRNQVAAVFQALEDQPTGIQSRRALAGHFPPG